MGLTQLLVVMSLVPFSVQQMAGVIVTGGTCQTTQWYDPMHSDQQTGVVDLKIVPMYYSTATKYAGRVFIVGGSTDKQAHSPSNKVQVYDPLMNTTTAYPSLLTPRALHSTVVLGGALVVCGGKSNVSTILDTCEYFLNNKWTAWDVKMPQALNSFGMAAIGDVGRESLHIFGGNTKDNAATPQTWELDTGSVQWSAGWPLPRARADFTTVTTDQSLIICGGFEKWASVNQTVVSTCDILDLYSGTWTQYTSLSTARHYHNMVALGNSVYVLGGFSDFLGTAVNSVEWYYPRANASWIRTPSLIKACAGAVAFSLE